MDENLYQLAQFEIVVATSAVIFLGMGLLPLWSSPETLCTEQGVVLSCRFVVESKVRWTSRVLRIAVMTHESVKCQFKSAE